MTLSLETRRGSPPSCRRGWRNGRSRRWLNKCECSVIVSHGCVQLGFLGSDQCLDGKVTLGTIFYLAIAKIPWRVTSNSYFIWSLSSGIIWHYSLYLASAAQQHPGSSTVLVKTLRNMITFSRMGTISHCDMICWHGLAEIPGYICGNTKPVIAIVFQKKNGHGLGRSLWQWKCTRREQHMQAWLRTFGPGDVTNCIITLHCSHTKNGVTLMNGGYSTLAKCPKNVNKSWTDITCANIM